MSPGWWARCNTIAKSARSSRNTVLSATQPICPKSETVNCETYCQEECDELHDKTSPFDWLGGGLADLLSGFSDSLKDLVPDLPEIPGIGAGIHDFITGVLSFIFTIVFLYALYRLLS